MSDTASQGDTQGTPSQGATGAPSGGGSPSNQGENGNQGLSNPFLAEVAEEHRDIIAPYLQKWDAGVTQRFQQLQSQFAPYKELGDPEVLQQAVDLMEMINTNPKVVFDALQQALEGEEGGGNGSDQGLEDGQELQGIPKEFQQKMDRLEQGLTAIAEHFLNQQNQATQQQEDSQLEEYLGALQKQFGDFDEEYVVAKMIAGASGEDAVKAFQTLTQGAVNQASQAGNKVPPILGGAGTVPQVNSQSVKDLDRKQTKELVASILSNANQG